MTPFWISLACFVVGIILGVVGTVLTIAWNIGGNQRER